MARASATQREIDRVHMARCIALAARHVGRTAPNPIVGAVIVNKRGEVVAEGAHKGPGTKHGEIDALAKLGRKADGHTLYVNLEPCNHHGRTPPCAPAVRDAGIARVVIGTEDPIPGHGGGIQVLRRGGVDVTVGILREECERANRPFLTWARHGRPAFTLKAGITLDGKIATITGQSKWITGEHARADVMRLRDQHDAVMVGIGTVIADDPWLTARLPGARNPKRIVLDTQLRTPIDSRLLPKKRGPQTIIACSERAPEAKEKALVAKGAEVWRCKTHRNGHIDFYPFSRRLAEEANIHSVLVEGGGEVHAYMLEYKLADELVLYIAPKVIGGPAKTWVGGKGLASLGSAHKFVFDTNQAQLGPDLRITATRAPEPPPRHDNIFDDDP
ncbi:MAG: bifunctional diaminohydroxyphosphoribosylaminopyrimidine deaminase/5-amino-6-(5-phosphoribosylamino)uracil reductase RibD [Myxococcota bacterium]|nr:bifunctional diaminohydroxyphosphoribosylaminopyrimidine deaminase/5-amino-6-(5-phosphoribosylamino)uracil reductase RibD [Deltaproteobacteria bacterium]MDQ3339203.1 bifunctional diaminohydroxyphosphoribosylaminopyrimidine deaminase/5-amino-6-(5-phosphoribosylamino)uracil reductase RibD [Myxococcota bacterium]